MAVDFSFSTSEAPVAAASQPPHEKAFGMPSSPTVSAFNPSHPAYSPTTPPRQSAPLTAPSRQIPITEVLGRFEELLVATKGELGRSRTLVEQRLEDLGAAMHRDMSVLNLQLSSQQTENTSDLFKLATQMSVLTDRVTRLERALAPYLGAPAPAKENAVYA